MVKDRIFAAFAFLTVAPVRARVALSEGLPFFPLVGATLGALEVLIAVLLWPHLGAFVTAILILLLELAATRALHWDGLLDTVDGLAAVSQEAALRAMRDPQAGGIGTVAVAGLLFLRVTLVARLLAAGAMGALYGAAVLGRFILLPLIAFFPYARPQGTGLAFRSPHTTFVWSGLASTVVFLLPLAGRPFHALLALLVASTLALLVALLFRRRYGGLTGDGYGAAEVLAETAVLLIYAWR